MNEFTGYDAAAASWDAGPGRLYAATADALLDAAPVPVGGARVLDLGAGTGLAGRAALRRGAASVVATDRAAEMLKTASSPRTPVLADAYQLPFADGAFDLVVAAFVINHLDDPGRGLRECRRIGGGLVASTFDRSWNHPAKSVVDEVMAQAGFVAPDWYTAVQVTNDQVKDPDALRELAQDAGFAAVEVTRTDVVTAIVDPSTMVAWRWGMAHLAPFVAGLDDATRGQLRTRAERAASGLPPVVVPMLSLSAS